MYWNKRFLLIIALLFVVFSNVLAQSPYRIRLADSTYAAQLRGVTGTRTAGITITGTYKSNFRAHQFNVTTTGRYDLYIDATGTGSSYTKDAVWSGTVGKTVVGKTDLERTVSLGVYADPDSNAQIDTQGYEDLSVTAPKLANTLDLSSKTIIFPDSQLVLRNLTTAAYNFVGSGGSVTNNPDDESVENKTGSTIGIKETYFTVYDTTTLKTLQRDSVGMIVNLKQLSSSNANGGGMFVYADSTHTEGFFAFDAITPGKQWIRQEYPSTIKAEWAGITTDGTGTGNASKINALIQQVDEGIIDIPLGKIRITEPIILKRGITLRGKNVPDDNDINSGSMFVLAANSDTSMLLTPFAASGYTTGLTHYMSIENIWFNGNADSQATFMSDRAIVDFSGAYVSSYIKNVTISNTKGTSLKLRNSDVLIQNVWVNASILNGSNDYAVIFGDSTNSGTNGVVNAYNLYVENPTTMYGKPPRDSTDYRTNAILVSQITNINFFGVHIEAAIKGITYEGVNFSSSIFGYTDAWVDTSVKIINDIRSISMYPSYKSDTTPSSGDPGVFLSNNVGGDVLSGVYSHSGYWYQSSSTVNSKEPIFTTLSAKAVSAKAKTSGTAYYGQSNTGTIFHAQLPTSSSTAKYFFAEDSTGNDLWYIDNSGRMWSFLELSYQTGYNQRIRGDAQNRFQVAASGALGWGSGSSSVDVSLYRPSAKLLQTIGTFLADTLRINTTAISSPATGDTYFKQGASSAPDTLFIYDGTAWRWFASGNNNP